MATGQCLFFKEFQKLTKSVSRLTEGQAVVGDLDFNEDEEKCTFHLSITPNAGFYKGATCKFQVVKTPDYPISAPDVHCLNQVYHPNIDLKEQDSSGNEYATICVNLLSDDWAPEVGLDGCVMAVLFLFHNPNPDDALNPLIDCGADEEEFAECVRMACRGEEVDGVVFDRLYPEDTVLDNELKQMEEVKDASEKGQEAKDDAVIEAGVKEVVENGDEVETGEMGAAGNEKNMGVEVKDVVKNGVVMTEEVRDGAKEKEMDDGNTEYGALLEDGAADVEGNQQVAGCEDMSRGEDVFDPVVDKVVGLGHGGIVPTQKVHEDTMQDNNKGGETLSKRFSQYFCGIAKVFSFIKSRLHVHRQRWDIPHIADER